MMEISPYRLSPTGVLYDGDYVEISGVWQGGVLQISLRWRDVWYTIAYVEIE